MYRSIQTLFCLLTLLLSIETQAADNLTLIRYDQVSSVPEHMLKLGGGKDVLSKQTYKDDDGKVRTDKKYYTITHSYSSRYKLSDVRRLLDPADGKLGSLFNETSVNKASASGQFNVSMNISTPLKDFDCQSVLTFSSRVEGKKEIFEYAFNSFNMVFTRMNIKVVAEEINGVVKINLQQIAAMKGSTYTKLDNYWAVGKFEKSFKSNMHTLKSGVGGY